MRVLVDSICVIESKSVPIKVKSFHLTIIYEFRFIAKSLNSSQFLLFQQLLRACLMYSILVKAKYLSFKFPTDSFRSQVATRNYITIMSEQTELHFDYKYCDKIFKINIRPNSGCAFWIFRQTRCVECHFTE